MRPDEILGKTVLVGLTYVRADGRVREKQQLYGLVVSADEERGVDIRQPSGEIITLPPTLESFAVADPGAYTLRSTGEVVTDPDLLCSWTITEPPETPSTIPAWVDHYVEQLGLYEAFAERMEALLRDLLPYRDIGFSWIITFDVRHDDLRRSLVDLWRDADRLVNPFDSELRAVGVTIGFHTPAELRELEELIEAEFVIDRAGSTTRAEAIDRNAGTHEDAAIAYHLPSYLVELDARRAELPEWSAYSGLKLRIDPTTELHDAWRDILYDLPFRHGTSYPAELRDLLSRVASTLVAADADVEYVSDAVDRLLEEYGHSVAAGELDLPLDGITLVAYLFASELVQSLVELGAELGFRHDPDDAPSWEDIEDYALWLLRRAGVASIAELDGFLRSTLPRARDTLSRFLKLVADEGYTPRTSREDLVVWLWLVFHRADARTVALAWYREEIQHGLNTLIGNPVGAREQDA